MYADENAVIAVVEWKALKSVEQIPNTEKDHKKENKKQLPSNLLNMWSKRTASSSPSSYNNTRERLIYR